MPKFSDSIDARYLLDLSIHNIRSIIYVICASLGRTTSTVARIVMACDLRRDAPQLHTNRWLHAEHHHVSVDREVDLKVATVVHLKAKLLSRWQ